MLLDVSVPATPVALPRLTAARLRLATWLGELAGLGSRLAGKGSGASIRGQILTRVAPDAFASLVRFPRIIAVSGTNGKTTTSHFIAEAVRAAIPPTYPPRVVTNADGANLHYGIASALSQSRFADLAVLETDERVVPDLIEAGHPEILVLLNFSRDQLDRHHEITALGRAWRTALLAAGKQAPVVVANASDPLIVWAASVVDEVVWVNMGGRWTADSALCPACGALLDCGPTGWHCACGLSQPESRYRVVDDQIIGPNGPIDPALNIPGSFNIANAACALAATELWGIDTETALTGMRRVQAPAGRFATAKINGISARLLLAKNPAGWSEALPLLRTNPVVLAIDSVAADGKDVSWLWDVDYESMRDTFVVVSGPRCADLAVRLSYAEVDHVIVPDLAAALSSAAKKIPGETIDVLSTYTPFQALLKMGGLR